MTPRPPAPVPGVCDVEQLAAPGAPAAPDLVIEVPHGADDLRHFEAVRSRLSSPLPERLERFFFVNTDVGAIECARFTALRVLGESSRPRRIWIVRGLVPRTFVDLNRAGGLGHEGFAAAGFTPQVPEYVTDARDVELLGELHRAYLEVALAAHRAACDAGGSSLLLHTYAPRSVGITRVDRGIVAALEDAYRPGEVERWPRRPDAEVIGRDPDDRELSPRAWIDALRARYDAAGVRLAENETYRLHPATTGHVVAARWPDRTLCVEINRGRLADPWVPLEPVRIAPANVERMAAPLAAAWLDWRGSVERERSVGTAQQGDPA